MSKAIKKPKLSANQILGQIASQQAELGALERTHAMETEAFQKKTAERAKRHNELTGGIAALQALVA